MLALVLKRFLSAAEVPSLSLTTVPDLLSAELSASEVLVRVVAACVNPSDVKNATGQMPHTTLPRILGRDYAGVVVRTGSECQQWADQAVYGTGGELGYLRDGCHASYLRIPAAALAAKPTSLTYEQAACVGVNFVTAYSGLHFIGRVTANDCVLITGASGGVGTAVRQLAKLAGAAVITVDRTAPHTPFPPSPSSADHAIYLADLPNGFSDLPARVASLPLFTSQPADPHTTNTFTPSPTPTFHPSGRGPSLIFDTLGGPALHSLLLTLAANGRLVNISTPAHGEVAIDLHDVYRRQLQLRGANSLYLDAVESAGVMRVLGGLFDEGSLSVLEIAQRVDVSKGGEVVGQAYESVAKGARGKVVLLFDGQMAGQR